MLHGDSKSVVLIAPKYFGYEKVIQRKLISYGYDVRLIYENLDRISIFYKFIKSKMPHKIDKVVNSYFMKKIKKCSNSTEYVIVIRGEYLNADTISYMKKEFSPNCKYILYQWDSAKNNPNSLKLEKEFDRVLSFDVEDCKNLGWIYRPLFYIDEYVEEQIKDIDILYVCSLHSDRVRILNELKNICKEKQLTYKAILYEKPYIYLKRKYIDKSPEFVHASRADMRFYPIKIRHIYKLYGRTKVVVDYTHPGQTGLTMRTIECIRNNCKIITNNELIQYADFYSEENFSIYRNEIQISTDFVFDEYKKNEDDIGKYSLDSFLEDIMGKE